MFYCRNKIPTDREILLKIYDTYFEDYETNSDDTYGKPYVPVNLREIAEKLKADENIVFGRIYYYLEPKYKYYKKESDSYVHLILTPGGGKHYINFFLLSSILAQLKDEFNWKLWSMGIALVALVISFVALFT